MRSSETRNRSHGGARAAVQIRPIAALIAQQARRLPQPEDQPGSGNGCAARGAAHFFRDCRLRRVVLLGCCRAGCPAASSRSALGRCGSASASSARAGRAASCAPAASSRSFRAAASSVPARPAPAARRRPSPPAPRPALPRPAARPSAPATYQPRPARPGPETRPGPLPPPRSALPARPAARPGPARRPGGPAPPAPLLRSPAHPVQLRPGRLGRLPRPRLPAAHRLVPLPPRRGHLLPRGLGGPCLRGLPRGHRLLLGGSLRCQRIGQPRLSLSLRSTRLPRISLGPLPAPPEHEPRADPGPPGRPTRHLPPGQHLAPPERGQRQMRLPGHRVRQPRSTPASPPPPPLYYSPGLLHGVDGLIG